MCTSRRLAAVLAIAVELAATRDLSAQRSARSFERFAHERGLSNATVTAIVQDRHGLLWFGTQDGLNGYDGSGFKVYRPVVADTNTLADAWITAVAASRSGPIWVGTLQGGLHRFDPSSGQVRRWRSRSGDSTTIPSDRVNAVLEAHDGTVWIGTSLGLATLDSSLAVLRQFRLTAPDDPPEFTNDILSLAEVPATATVPRAIWVGTRRGLFVIDPASRRVDLWRVTLTNREIRALLVDGSTIWVGSQDDFVAVDTRTRALQRRFSRAGRRADNPVADGVNALARGPDGTIWIGSDAGIVTMDADAANVTPVRPDPADSRSLAGPIVRSVFVDRGGVIWIGHESHGLSKHAPSAVTFAPLRHRRGVRDGTSLSDGYVRGISEDRRGGIWIGTQNGGLNRLDPRTGRITAYGRRDGDPRSLPGNNVWAILEDRTGTMWVGHHVHGLGTFDPATGVFRRSPLVPADASVNVLYEDRRGTLHVGTEGRGLYSITPDRQRVTSFGATLGDQRVLANNDVQSVIQDRAGALWIGGTDGLTRLDPATNAATPYRGMLGVAGALSSSFVTNIVEDSKGTIWVATKGGGLNRFDARSGHFRAYGTADGLPHSFVYGVLEDVRGRLWLSTDDGIATFDPTSGLVTRYGIEDGLQAREYNRRAHFRAADGTMYFGGINGVDVVRPDRVVMPVTPPAVSLIAIESDGERRSAAGFTADSVVRLSHDVGAATITFAALDFAAPEKIQYAYRLEGVDRDWVPAGNRRQATYASLPTGLHVFRVRAAGPSGDWSPTPAAVTIAVSPAWWATWWARTLQVALLAAGVLAVIRLRLRSARKHRVELEQRVDEQTRDLIAAQARLSESLDRERTAARELVQVTAAVPGAVFRLRDGADGRPTFDFVSEGITALHHRDDGNAPDPKRDAERLLATIHPDDRTKLDEALAASRASRADLGVELRLQPTDDGGPRWLSIQAHASRETDGSTTWTGVMTDATVARRAESERAKLEAKMLQAQKAESLAVLAGGVAHDFNNVLLSVLVGAELLEDDVRGNDRAVATARNIRKAGERAAELTQQMLAYAGKGRLSMERVNLAKLSEEMLSLVRATVPRTIDLQFEAMKDGTLVEADSTQLRQIVLNLVTNAAEAIGDKPGRVSVRVRTEDRPLGELGLMHAAADMPVLGPFVALEVADDGCGMDAALIERIFDPFFSTKFTGRGLGLAALLGIVRAHHGGLRVTSMPGMGTTFSIYLPLASGTEETAKPVRKSRLRQWAPRAVNVLVADDEENVRNVARAVLEGLGYGVVQAEDGEAALAAADTHDIGIYLLDVTMPRMSGTDAARRLRARGTTAPIVLMSGYAEEDLLTRGVTADANAFLKKPFLAADLAATLRDLVRA